MLVSTLGSDAIAGNTFNQHWGYLIDKTNLIGKKVRIKIDATYATGGYGNPELILKEGTTLDALGTSLLSIPLSPGAGVITYDQVYTFGSSIAAVLFFDFHLLYSGSTLTVSHFSMDVIG
jgi:hypothetical protein